MTKCQSCGGRAQLVLCGRCEAKIREILREMPWWLDRLTETAVGHARLGTPVRRARAAPKHFRGDDSPIAEFPQDDDQTTTSDVEALRQRHIAVRRQALAMGGVHPSASELLDTITNMLSTWIRDICETRSVEPPALRHAKPMGAWLAARTNTIAAADGADEFLDELTERFRAVRRVVNRPTPLVPYGPCPAKSGDKRCATPLLARVGASEVTCARCKTQHDTSDIIDQYLSGRDDQHFTRKEILIVMSILGESISARRFQRWCTPKKLPDGTTQPPQLRPRGYRRPDGRRGIARHSDEDEPVYMLGDVRKLMEQPLCSMPDCEDKHHARGLCNTHYKQASRLAHA